MIVIQILNDLVDQDIHLDLYLVQIHDVHHDDEVEQVELDHRRTQLLHDDTDECDCIDIDEDDDEVEDYITEQQLHEAEDETDEHVTLLSDVMLQIIDDDEVVEYQINEDADADEQ